MPRESLILDFENAFLAFHNAQCSKFRITHSPTDFKNALKELDGTFVATRKITDSVLVRFQNPSIRDFMQNLLLNGELLQDVINSLVFFEQAQWFAETLREEQPQIPLKVLEIYSSDILDALKKLFETESCLFSIVRHQLNQRIQPKQANAAERLLILVNEVANQQGGESGEWISQKIYDLAIRIDDGTLSPSLFERFIKELRDSAIFETNAGARLISALIDQVLIVPEDLNEFETLAAFISVLPLSFSESILKLVQQNYSDFAERFVANYDDNDPEDIRNDASRIEDVGNLLGVVTDAEQETLRERALDIEAEQESRTDDDNERHGGNDFDVCSDGELDSMFGTLQS